MLFLNVPIAANTELGESLISYFKKNNAQISKEEIIKLIREHKIYFQNKPIGFLPFKIFKKGNAQVYFDQKPDQNSEWTVHKKDILFEDKWLIVVNKPSGIPSQSSLKLLQGHAYSSVICMLRDRKPFTSPQLFLMHRLDMDTSGVLLMTKKTSINKGMQQVFEKKEIQKTYWAVSKTDELILPPPIVKSYLARKPDDQHKFKFGSFSKDHKGAKFSETHFKKLSSNKGHHLFEVSPKTGRSHQIRVHLSENGHPILGDVFYKGDKASHLFLHAKELSFVHPETKEQITIKAPLPQHWNHLLDKVGLNT